MEITELLRRIRTHEQEMEHAVLRALQARPLYALEITSSLGEDRREVALAVERCHNGGSIVVTKPGGRFSLA